MHGYRNIQRKPRINKDLKKGDKQMLYVNMTVQVMLYMYTHTLFYDII